MDFLNMYWMTLSCRPKCCCTFPRTFAMTDSAGLTIVPVVPWEPPLPRRQRASNQLPIFYHAVLTSERWENVHKPQVSCRPTCNVWNVTCRPTRTFGLNDRRILIQYLLGQPTVLVKPSSYGSRGRGRPRRRWKEDISDWTGLRINDAARSAEDRETWRRVIRAANPSTGGTGGQQ